MSGKSKARLSATAAIVNLSATGSMSLPHSVIMLKRRAILPSSISVSPETAMTSAAQRKPRGVSAAK